MIGRRLKGMCIACAVALAASCGGGEGALPGGGIPDPDPNPEPAPDELPVPRIIFSVMLDDADLHDFGFNSVDALTPNIDAIKNEGVFFSEFYAGSAICSPTRVSLLTGEQPISFGLSRLWPDVKSRWSEPATSNEDQYYMAQRGVPSGVATIATVAREAGYETFHIGKWHAGNAKREHWPDAKGFDSFQIMTATPYEGEMAVYTENGPKTVEGVWRSTYQADEIISRIENLGEDLFINWWPIEPHYPWYVPPTFSDELNSECCDFDLSTDRGKVLSMMYSIDHEFGRVVAELKKRDLFDETLLLVFSDNGGQKSVLSPQRSLSGFKNTLSEGGIKVPMLVSWPEVVASSGVSNKVITTMDVLPTFSEIFSQQESVNGESFLDQISSAEDSFVNKDGQLWYLRPDSVKKGLDDELVDELAYRRGCYKVHKKTGYGLEDWNLYDICADPYEMIDLSFSLPAVHRELGRDMYREVAQLTLAAQFDNLSSRTALLESKFLDIHQDDITVATGFVSSVSRRPSANIYLREGSLEIVLDQESDEMNRVVVQLNGVASTAVDPDLRDIQLIGEVAKDGLAHSMAFVIKGFFRTGSSLSLYIDGVLVDSKYPAIDSLEISDSVYALSNSDALSYAGDDGEVFTDYRVYKLAMKPGSPLLEAVIAD